MYYIYAFLDFYTREIIKSAEEAVDELEKCRCSQIITKIPLKYAILDTRKELLL